MAKWNDNDEYWEVPSIDATEQINEILYGAYWQQDRTATDLFEKAVFDSDMQAYQDLVDYMWDEYGIDFEDAYSWEDFREWYDGQAS